MHFHTHTQPEDVGRAGRWQVALPRHPCFITTTRSAACWICFDELGITENTIVMYSTDNGPHMNSWPDAGMTPFRNEKNSNWEGAYRVPAMVRWPGHIPAGSVLNGIVSHADWFVTLLSAAGVPDIAEATAGRPQPERHDLQGAPRRARPVGVHHRPEPDESGAPSTSFMSPMMATSPQCGSTTGSSSSSSSAA